MNRRGVMGVLLMASLVAGGVIPRQIQASDRFSNVGSLFA